MNQLDKLFTTALIGISLSYTIPAFGALQQLDEEIRMMDNAQIDSTSTLLINNAKNAVISDDFRPRFHTELKLKDNTILDRSYHSGNGYGGMDGYFFIDLDYKASKKIFKTDDLQLKLLTTLDQNTKSVFQASLISMDWERPRETNLGFSISLSHMGNSYSPTLEYLMRKGSLSLDKKLTYGWIPNENSWIRRHGLEISNTLAWGYSRSLMEYQAVNLGWEVDTKTGNSYRLGFFNEYNNMGGSFQILKDIRIPEGRYSSAGFTLGIDHNTTSFLNTSLELTIRELLNSNGYSFSINPTWKISPELNLSSGINLHRYRFNHKETLKLVLPYLKSTYAAGTKMTVDIFSQYNTETGRLAFKSDIVYKPKDGHKLELAYCRNRISEVANPFLKTQLQGSNLLFLKYTYSFAN
ncbi:hypothetical protein [Flagellimonas algicola]|uniref:OmpL-like beta-barrel porin-2 n=1 Tax=Flagellimonas algicola TaxID=2583815 RepID=A0ABY2WP87_9FLAO|nr:hypothetical protein [Allomuricauda algicola]TMU56557.1 hypothetical protein FGG15_03180 [Allomuricauda algicola]